MKQRGIFLAAVASAVSQIDAFSTTRRLPQRPTPPMTPHFYPAHSQLTLNRWKAPRTIQYASTSDKNCNDDDGTTTPILPTIAMLGLPLASAIFPALLELARSLPANSSEQFAVVAALFVSNRAYLYAMGATIVGLAGLRGATDRPQLGQRITDLTEELLYRPSLGATSLSSSVDRADENRDEKPSIIQSLADSGVQETLDQVSTETQALILPLLVSFLFALSVFLLPFWSGAPNGSEVAVAPELQELLSQILPTISQVWNVGLLVLFTRSEVRRLGFELKISSSSAAAAALAEWGVAAGITGLAFVTPLWPVQNFVNMALAILVARAIQLDKFVAVVGALSLLTVYDATSVFLIPAAGAASVDMMMMVPTTTNDVVVVASSSSSSMDLASSEGGAAAASAMGSVALQKLTSASFQPGLLVTKIGDRLGGSLGLGDAVFPSLLANFVRRFDLDQEKDTERLSLFAVSIGGYLLGCLACEFAPLISTSGLPALVFVIPFMLGSVISAAAVSGELEDLWKFDPKKE
jgi:hypothetical protein